MIELKRCPFCGSPAHLGGSDDVCGHPYWYIYCRECGAMTCGSEDKQEAADIWNRRIEDDRNV